MTKYAIISDIHANYDALEYILKDAEKRNVDKIICLGDLVNKYFMPDKVVDSIRSQSDIVIKGNHDYTVTTDDRFKWVRGKLGIDRLEYLENLPLKEQIYINKILINLYHASPNSLTAMFNPVCPTDGYLGGMINDYREMFENDAPQVSLLGHSHISYIGSENENKEFELHNKSNIIVDKNARTIVNVGSVGEPETIEFEKDGTVKKRIDYNISYAVIDDTIEKDKINIQIIKLPYKNLLKKIYFDRLQMEEKKEAPLSPNDDKKIYDSLVDMGENIEELNKGIKK